jgi:hypothetical protein
LIRYNAPQIHEVAMPVPLEVKRLLERYEAQREAYESGQYKETEIRVEFIDPFFKALGWDVHNEQGYAEAYKDVIHEDALKIGGATEAPDACFRIGGVRQHGTPRASKKRKKLLQLLPS